MPVPSQATAGGDPQGNLPCRADVVVVGAGAIGLATAYELSLRGAEVVVLERGRIGDGTSSGNAGFVVPSHVLPVPEPAMFATVLRGMLAGRGPVTAKASLRSEYLRWLARFLGNCRAAAVQAAAPVLAELGKLSAGLYKQWLAAEQIDCCYASGGLLNVYGDDRAFAGGCRRAQREGEFGVPSRIMTASEARQREPALNDSVAGAVFYPEDAGLDPGRFVRGLASVLARRGVRLAGETAVRDVRAGPGRVRLVTSRGEVQAGEVVLAAGCWTPALGARCGSRVPIQPAKGYSLTLPMPRRGPRCRMLLGEKHVAVAPMGDRLRLSGWFELGRADRALPPSRLAHVAAAARSRLHLDSTELLRAEAWAGFRPVTPDGLPIVGRSTVRNLTFACGHAMLGMTLAPATARLTAQTVCGQAPDVDIRPISPARFQ